jgi:hypothetical protein
LVAAINELHERTNYSFHWRQKVFLLQCVVERPGADVCPGYVRTDGVEVDVLLWQIFAVRTDEPYHTTAQGSAFLAHSIANHKDGLLTVLQPCIPEVLLKRQ